MIQPIPRTHSLTYTTMRKAVDQALQQQLKLLALGVLMQIGGAASLLHPSGRTAGLTLIIIADAILLGAAISTVYKVHHAGRALYRMPSSLSKKET